MAGAGRGKCFACLCEDVTAKDIHLSVDEGYDSIELSKRYTTATMGPCQGRMCQLPAVRLMAQETGQDLARVGTTTARPPWSAGPARRARRPPVRARQALGHPSLATASSAPASCGPATGAAPTTTATRRPRRWPSTRARGSSTSRRSASSSSAGPEAGAFLDRLYPNRFANLEPGRIRYGVLTSDAGRIMDDGTICRLDDESFYVTTTSSGAGAVEQWFSWWLADWRMEVRAHRRHPGPRRGQPRRPARPRDHGPPHRPRLLQRGLRLPRRASARRSPACPALLLRIGFVGEVGYEIHFPAAHGQHVWDAILEAGAEHGIRPFGLEPQRILRLQKLHILVGQDTDSESTPYGAAMPWIVKLDKDEDFIGSGRSSTPPSIRAETALVGFTLPDGDVPTEGAAVLDERGEPVGQVTSARHSRQLGHVIGMAWVPADAGQRRRRDHDLRRRAARLRAEVITRPFYDPDGEVLRS